MEELLFGLTPSELWVWNYLQFLAHRQGGSPVLLPRPGEDPRAERVMTRKHLKRTLKSLKAKSRLTKLIIPRSKSNKIEVYLSIGGNLNFGGVNVPNNEKGDLKDPNRGVLRTIKTPITTLGAEMSPINEVITGGLTVSGPSTSLSSSSFKDLVELKQGDLKGEIRRMEESKVRRLLFFAEASCTVKVRSRKASDKAKLYAMLRFIQEATEISSPQAWVDTVARQAEKEFSAAGRRGASAASPPARTQERRART
jgi:hypothetical protein